MGCDDDVEESFPHFYRQSATVITIKVGIRRGGEGFAPVRFPDLRSTQQQNMRGERLLKFLTMEARKKEGATEINELNVRFQEGIRRY